MDNDTPRPGSPPPRSRPGPTIDLEATEVAREDAGSRAGGAQSAKPNAGRHRGLFGFELLSARRPPDLPWPLIASGIGGAALMLMLVLFASLVSGRDREAQALAARLSDAEQKLSELAARPLPASVNPRTVEEFGTRLARVEASLAAPRAPAATNPPLANRIATLEGALKSLDEAIGVVGRRSDDIGSIARDARQRAEAANTAVADLARKGVPGAAAPAADGAIDALGNRIAALERSTKALEAELAKRAAGDAPDRSARRATVADLLKSAVERGDPFATELAAAKSLAADPKILSPLEPFAATGVPTATALAREFSGLAPALAKAAGEPARDGSFLEKLQSNAGKLVRIRPVDEVPGDDPSATIARAQARAKQDDFAAALAALGKLPAAARAPAQAWIAKVEARNAAVAASRQFAADAIAALGQQ